jgi:hypothetical protein
LRALRERFRALEVLVMSRFQARFWEDSFLEKTSAALNPEAENGLKVFLIPLRG